MTTIAKDLRYALRTLRSSPVFACVAVLSLALGIGANASIFSLLDQLILRPIPVHNPNELVAFKMEGSHYGSNWGMNAISYPMYKDFSEHNNVFSGMFCRFTVPSSMGYGNQTERVRTELVSGTYFPVLGIGPARGRVFSSSEDRYLNGHPLAVLSYSFWKQRFGGDPNIVGRNIIVNGHSMDIIGVAQRGFEGIQLEYPTEIWIPITMKAQMTPFWDGMKDRRMRWTNTFGRLKPGVSLEQAQASLQPFMKDMLRLEVQEAAFRNASSYTRQQFLRSWIHLLPGAGGYSYIREGLTTPMWMLLCLTAGVLLIACTNIASLLLARATARQREMAIRLAIGASRKQIIRQLLTESLLMSFFGAILGLGFSFAMTAILLRNFVQRTTGDYQPNLSAAPDAPVLAFTFVVMLVTAIAFGLAPALRASGPDLAPTLKDQAGAVIGGTNVTLRKGLVSFQVALSLLLLIGAGLFIRTLQNLRQLGPGFPTDRLIGFEIDPSLNGYSSDKTKLLYKRLMTDLATVPGVQSVGLASVRILEGNEWDSSMTVEGYNAKPGQSPEPYMNSISPDYFKALGVSVLQGRDFTENDVQQVKHGPKDDDWNPAKIMINQSFAHKYFAGRNPIGRHTGFGSDPGTKTDMEVIGVVKDIKYTNLRDEIPPQAFVPFLADRNVGGMTVYLRTSLDPDQVIPVVETRLRQIDRTLPIFSMRSTEEQIDLSLRSERFVASLSSTFGIVATSLAVIGLYGVMAFTVARRTREIGIRVALGALRGNVLWLIMREVLLVVTIGIAIGVPTAVALTSLVQKLLFGLSPRDPYTVVGATLLSILVCSLAGFVPALRASNVNATIALRYE